MGWGFFASYCVGFVSCVFCVSLYGFCGLGFGFWYLLVWINCGDCGCLCDFLIWVWCVRVVVLRWVFVFGCGCEVDFVARFSRLFV